MLISMLLIAGPAAAQTWVEVPNTRAIAALNVVRLYNCQTPIACYNPNSLFAFSGGDLVQIGGIWGFWMTGGGHAATPDNSTIFVPFDGSGPRVLQPTFAPPDNVGYEPASDGQEIYNPFGIWTDAHRSRHTYSSILTIAVGGKPALWMYAGSLFIGSGSGTSATRVFDLAQTMAQADARPDQGWAKKAPAPAGTVASSSGWDPVQKRVVVRSRGFIGAYYPDQDRWEDWNLSQAPMGSDFEASVAVDVAGRKMYVLGDRLAEVIDLDARTWTDLRGKAWAQAALNTQQGPGVAWHERSKRLVLWTGGQTLTLVDPATDAVTTVTMAGAVPVSSRQTYGRFRIIPGTDQVVLWFSVGENILTGTLPGGPPVPPPSVLPPPSNLRVQ